MSNTHAGSQAVLLAGLPLQPKRRQRRWRPLLLVAALGLVLAGRLRSSAPTLLLTASAEAGSTPAAAPCEALRVEVEKRDVAPRISSWQKAAVEGRTISGFGSQAGRFLNRTLDIFDQRARHQFGDAAASLCKAEREVLDKKLHHQLHSIFLVQRSTIEQVLYQRLTRELLRQMRQKRREIEVKEKQRLLERSMKEYDSQVRHLQPSFVSDSERIRAQNRLSQLQFGIADTPEGKEMQQRWKMEKLRQMPTRQPKEISISYSPGMRLMFRPGGFGNMQVYSRRQVGPPHNPSEISVAMLNDGNVIDVYNKKPKPALVKFQPTIGIDISAG